MQEKSKLRGRPYNAHASREGGIRFIKFGVRRVRTANEGRVSTECTKIYSEVLV